MRIALICAAVAACHAQVTYQDLVNPSPWPVAKVIDCVRSLGAPIRPVSPEDWLGELRADSEADASPGSAALALRPRRIRTPGPPASPG